MIQDNCRTYMWQEQYGYPVFRFQTNDPVVAKRMRQRKKFILVGYGINARLWLYSCSFYKPQDARRTLRHITGQKIHKDGSMNEFLA